MNSISKFPKADRRAIAEKIMELGNIAAGSLLFTQITNSSFNFPTLLFGLIVLVLTYVMSILYLKGD